jgi:hypothetical protein
MDALEFVIHIKSIKRRSIKSRHLNFFGLAAPVARWVIESDGGSDGESPVRLFTNHQAQRDPMAERRSFGLLGVPEYRVVPFR